MEEIKQNAAQDIIPYIAHEGMMVRMERQIKRLWIALITSILVSVLIVGGFLWYLNQYDFVSNEEVTVDGTDGIANYIGKDGDIYYNGTNSDKAYPLTHQEE